MIMALLLVGGAHAALLNPNDPSGINSFTWEQQFQSFVANSLDARFNTTQTYSNGTHTLLWVPKFTSSTSCGIAQLQTYSGACTTVNMSRNAMVTDEFSEVGMGLAMSNRTNEFNYWANTVTTLIGTGAWGSAPSWIYCRNGPSITDLSGADSASDGTARIVKAFYIASQNPANTAANRTIYLQLANSMLASHYEYETKRESYSTMFGTVSVWLAGGRDAAQSFSSDPFIWGGYFYDSITALLAGCAQTGNLTYCAAANNITMQMLAAQLNNTGGGSNDFRVSPFSWRYNSGPVALNPGNTYHFDGANPQWDDSDRPRGLQDPDILRVANITYSGILPEIYQNLTNYVTAWGGSGTYTNDTTCLQYFYNGTCSTTITGGYYQNGLGAFLHTYQNTTGFIPKVNETVQHYNYGTLTFDSTSCGTGLMYRGVRPTKAIGVGLQKEFGIYNLSLSNSIDIDIFSTNGSSIYENITITLSGSTTQNTTYTTTGTFLFTGLGADSYSLTFSGTNWTTTYYVVTVSGGSVGTLNAYLAPIASTGNNSVVFSIADYDNSGQAIVGATATMSQNVNGTLTLIQSKTSDITGRVLFTYTSNTLYAFSITATGYQGLSFTLDPVLYSSYDLRLQRTNTLNTSIEYLGVSTSLNTSLFYADRQNDVRFSITSPDGTLTTYSFNITYPGGSINQTGNNAYGEIFAANFNTTGATVNDYVTVNYCYDTTISSQRCYRTTYPIIGSYGNTTIIANTGNTYGLGVFERVLISTIIVIVIVGICMIVSGALLAFVIGLVLLAFLAYSGFMPPWSTAITMVVGVLIVARRSSE
jgi:hypothetical protein